MIDIHGKVTDFNGNPIEGASVEILDAKFEPIYRTITDRGGSYSLSVGEGVYVAMYACKDYPKENFEYWAWNVIAHQDLEINPRIDGLEVYAINAWMPQGAMPSMQAYFRPMSLMRAKKLSQEIGVGFPASKDELKHLKVIDIAPRLTKEDLEATVDAQTVEVLEINKVTEALDGGQSMYAYVIQTALPKQQTGSDYCRICIALRDSETRERGEGCLFWKKPSYMR